MAGGIRKPKKVFSGVLRAESTQGWPLTKKHHFSHLPANDIILGMLTISKDLSSPLGKQLPARFSVKRSLAPRMKIRVKGRWESHVPYEAGGQGKQAGTNEWGAVGLSSNRNL